MKWHGISRMKTVTSALLVALYWESEHMSVDRWHVLARSASSSHLTLPIIIYSHPGSHVCQNMTFRTHFPSAMGSGDGTQVVKFVWEALSCWAILLVCPIFKGTRSVGTLVPALHSCAEEILTAIFPTCLLIWEQESRPINRTSVSVSWCMNVLSSVFALLRACFSLWLWWKFVW